MTKSRGFAGAFMVLCLSGLIGCDVVDEGDNVALSEYGGASYGGSDGSCGCECGGCEVYDPVVTTSGSSAVTISVGPLWYGYTSNNTWWGYINGGTFHALTPDQTLNQLESVYFNAVARLEYCCTLKFIIIHNYNRVPASTQAAMLSAWGSWCTAVNPEAC